MIAPSVSETEQHCYWGKGGCAHGLMAYILRVLYFFAIFCECPKDF